MCWLEVHADIYTGVMCARCVMCVASSRTHAHVHTYLYIYIYIRTYIPVLYTCTQVARYSPTGILYVHTCTSYYVHTTCVCICTNDVHSTMYIVHRTSIIYNTSYFLSYLYSGLFLDLVDHTMERHDHNHMERDHTHK